MSDKEKGKMQTLLSSIRRSVPGGATNRPGYPPRRETRPLLGASRKSNKPQQQAAFEIDHPHHYSGDNKKHHRGFRVTVPQRMLFYTALVFVGIPLLLFLWMLTHHDGNSRYHNHQQHQPLVTQDTLREANETVPDVWNDPPPAERTASPPPEEKVVPEKEDVQQEEPPASAAEGNEPKDDMSQAEAGQKVEEASAQTKQEEDKALAMDTAQQATENEVASAASSSNVTQTKGTNDSGGVPMIEKEEVEVAVSGKNITGIGKDARAEVAVKQTNDAQGTRRHRLR